MYYSYTEHLLTGVPHLSQCCIGLRWVQLGWDLAFITFQQMELLLWLQVGCHQCLQCSYHLCTEHALANWHAPSESMLHCPRLSSTRTCFVLNTSANAIAPLIPIGLLFMYNICTEHLLTDMLHLSQCCSVLGWDKWGCGLSSVSEVLFWGEKSLSSDFSMSNFLSVVLRWNPLMISSTDWEAWTMPCSSSLRAFAVFCTNCATQWQMFRWIKCCQWCKQWSSPFTNEQLWLFRWGMCTMRWERVEFDPESNLLSSRLSVSILLTSTDVSLL